MSWFQIVSLVITSVGLINCVVFCVCYWYASGGSWFSNEYGRFMMIFIGCLGSLFALVIANRVFGMWPGRQIITLVLYFSYVLATFWPIRLLFLSNSNRRKTIGKHQRETSEAIERM